MKLISPHWFQHEHYCHNLLFSAQTANARFPPWKIFWAENFPTVKHIFQQVTLLLTLDLSSFMVVRDKSSLDLSPQTNMTIWVMVRHDFMAILSNEPYKLGRFKSLTYPGDQLWPGLSPYIWGTGRKERPWERGLCLSWVVYLIAAHVNNEEDTVMRGSESAPVDECCNEAVDEPSSDSLSKYVHDISQDNTDQQPSWIPFLNKKLLYSAFGLETLIKVSWAVWYFYNNFYTTTFKLGSIILSFWSSWQVFYTF